MFTYLIVALQAFCIYHVIKNRNQYFWIFIIIFIPAIGSIIYLITQVYNKRDASIIKENLTSVLIPTKKVKDLEKYETKIEQNLDTHKKTLKFFQENDTCPVCTQSIDTKFKEDKCNHETTTISKLELGLSQLVGELSKQEEKITAYGKVSQKIQSMNVEIAKVASSLSALKKHSDQIQQEISTASQKDSDIEKIELELEQMKIDLAEADEKLKGVQEEKDYVDVLREILNEAIAHQSSDEDLLTSKDVQNLLNISHATLWRKEKEGLIPYSKIGSKKLYKRSDIINVLK